MLINDVYLHQEILNITKQVHNNSKQGKTSQVTAATYTNNKKINKKCKSKTQMMDGVQC